MSYGPDLTSTGGAFASESYGSTPADAFDDDSASYWSSNDSDTAWIGCAISGGGNVAKITITARADNGKWDRTPTDFEIRAANSEPSDGATDGTLIHSVSGSTGWTAGETRSYEFSNSSSYTHYWIYITGKDEPLGSRPEYIIVEITMHEFDGEIVSVGTGSSASAPAAGFERAFFVDMGSGASVSVPAADVSKLIPMATGSAASAPAAGFEQAFFVDMATGASVSVPAADVSKLIPMATGSAASAPAADVSRLFPMGTGSAASEFSATATVPIFVELALVYGLEASADLEIVYNLSEIVTSELEIVYNLRAMGFFELEMKYDLLDSTPVFVELPIIYSLMAGAGDPGSGIQFGDFVYDSTHVI